MLPILLQFQFCSSVDLEQQLLLELYSSVEMDVDDVKLGWLDREGIAVGGWQGASNVLVRPKTMFSLYCVIRIVSEVSPT